MSKDFWQKMKKPIVGLAPMDGYTDSAYRRICKEVNPDIITYTEFTAAMGLKYGAKKLKEKLYFEQTEKPIIAQIFGKDTESFIKAAQLCEEMGFDGIDLNMGCPSKKVVKSEQGVALRRKPDLAYKLVAAVAKNTILPVSVKTRLGLNDASDLVEFALGVQEAGADMLCVHARTFKEPYKVPAHWAPVYELKKQLRIPVLGNGGIESMEDGLEKVGNLDGFLIGQASIGNPWVFLPQAQQPQTFKEKKLLIKRHAKLLLELKGAKHGSHHIRKLLLAYVRNMPNAKSYRMKLVRVEGLEEIYEVLEQIEHCKAKLN
jgi:tRNA-dihydrouridine synthase B